MVHLELIDVIAFLAIVIGVLEGIMPSAVGADSMLALAAPVPPPDPNKVGVKAEP